jgi:hypothetical protein
MGSYRLEELQGWAKVWRARHRMLARDSAVKVIRPEALGADRPGRGEDVT